ncbi:MAG TPA: hypothetical protein VGH37_09200 [Candidatus Acidoferrum sp.]|jgi:hypothetical protein
MISTHLILAIAGIIAAVGLSFGLAITVGSYLRYGGKRVVKCPETKQPAAVHINVAKAAREALFRSPNIRLDQCSRWPERAGCGQDCLAEIKADPDQCLVWNMVDSWYKGKSCAYCQKPFVEIHWHERHPALLGPDRSIMQWNEVPAENLPQIFQNYLPVCWNCYIAESFRRKNPERVVDRTWERGVGGEYVPKETESPATKPVQ